MLKGVPTFSQVNPSGKYILIYIKINVAMYIKIYSQGQAELFSQCY